MALLLPLGFLARERLPPLDRHVDVGGLDLDGVDDPPLLLASDHRGRSDERIVDVALVVVDGSLHTLLRQYRQRAAFRGEEERRTRLVAELRQARLTGIRVAVSSEALEARLSGLPDGVSVEPGRIEVRFSGAGRRRRRR